MSHGVLAVNRGPRLPEGPLRLVVPARGLNALWNSTVNSDMEASNVRVGGLMNGYCQFVEL